MKNSENPLRIVHTESSCGWGGQEIRILEESRAMQARGHRITIVCPQSSKLFERAADWGIEVVALPIEKKRLGALLALRRWLKSQNDIDILNTHSSTDSWLAALALRMGCKRIPIIRTRHISAAVKVTASNRWLYGCAAQFVVTTGEKLRRELIENLHLTEQNTQSIPTGIDTTRFTPGDKIQARRTLNLDQSAQWIGIVATLRSWKGHVYLLEAFAALKAPNARLLIVGEGPQMHNLRNKVQELAIAERVHFAGNQKEVTPWLQAMDVFALPSYANEGVSQAVMQAMACALPVVTTDVGSMTDVIIPNETGLLVPIRDSAALGQALSELLNNPDLAQKIGQAAHRFAQEHCGIDHMVERMEAIFNRYARGTR